MRGAATITVVISKSPFLLWVFLRMFHHYKWLQMPPIQPSFCERNFLELHRHKPSRSPSPAAAICYAPDALTQAKPKPNL